MMKNNRFYQIYRIWPALLLLVPTWTAAADQPPTVISNTPSAADRPPAYARAYIVQLGHAEYTKREQAQRALIAMGAVNLDQVIDAAFDTYVTTDDVEVMVRLRDVMRELVMKHIFAKPKGFLGVQFHPRSFWENDQDPVHAMEVLHVVPNTAASNAGIQPNDRIVKIGNLKIAEDTTTEDFVHVIHTAGPGRKIGVTVMRETEFIELEVALGELPADIRKRTYTNENKKKFFSNWLEEKHRQRQAEAQRKTSQTGQP